MANSEMKLSLVLTGRDDGARRLLEQTQRETERLKKMQLSRGQQNVFNQRYATLGIRSEQAIRNKIAKPFWLISVYKKAVARRTMIWHAQPPPHATKSANSIMNSIKVCKHKANGAHVWARRDK